MMVVQQKKQRFIITLNVLILSEMKEPFDKTT